MPHATGIVSATQPDGKLTVERELEGGALQVVELPLPCLVTVQTGMNEVRYASLKGIMAAKKKPLVEMKLAELVSDAASKIAYGGYELPPARKAGIKVKDVGELVDKLRNEARVV